MEHSSTDLPDPRPGGQERGGEEGLVRRQSARLQARLRPVVQVAASIVDKVRWQAVLSGAAGAWLWGVAFYPFASFGRVGVLVLGVVALVVLLIPAGVLLVFWAGLRELIGVPDRLLAMAGEGEAHAGALLGAVSGKDEPRKTRRLWRFFRTVLDLRALILGSKEMLLQFALVARVVNPAFIVVLFVAFVASLLLIGAAAVALIVVAF